ncbi:MAG: hypothetical protein DYH05_09415 [Acidobacteria bacterium ACB1]|nr:hypothetical protein [Pyrinomonadaceae bacterium]MCE7962699.1 hypothetical protein [Acidobacteria bacterium ACB1]RIJ95034.1 MAG: hypothetical protein DCC44_03085 [Acidobacteriota bacterium]
MKRISWLIAAMTVALCFSSGVASGQGKRPAKKPQPAKPAIFAVINDGKTVTPIALVAGGKLSEPTGGGDDAAKINAFAKAYYKPKASYRLIFGGADAGTVRISSFDPKAECAKNTAQILIDSTKVKPKGFVMALATNAPSESKNGAFRRRPTDVEKAEIEALVRREYEKNKLTPKALHYQNLTAIDTDGDGVAELVGSYWVEVAKNSRALLFFIAQKGKSGKYAFGYTDYRRVDQDGVMSGDIKDVDTGIYHELLLDYFDADGDGKAEVYTFTRSFEGEEFNVYHFDGSKWTKSYTFSDYVCAY